MNGIPKRVTKDVSLFAVKHGIRKVILFGSRARGNHTERSDVDIAVSGGDFDAFYWDVKENTHSLLTFDMLDNFSNCLDILKHADFEFADNDDIYRTGVIGQFNLTFELAWKALQAVLRLHGAQGAETGSPREILQLGYKLGFVNDSAVWLLMLKKRNASVHIYDEDEVDELLLLIRDSFIPALINLRDTLNAKLSEAEEDWNS